MRVRIENRRGPVAVATRVLLLFLGLVMMAAPAAADPGFDRWVQSFWPEARAKGVSETTFRRAFSGVTPDQEVIRLASRQPEFVKPIWEYLDSAVSDQRIANGREMLRKYDGVLDAIEARYKVSRYVVVAIWGMESSYGAVLDNRSIVRPVVRSLATLAYAGGSRARFGKTQLLAALQILERGDVTPDRMYGSWAGAMGHTQFIPTTYNAHAVDFDGDGRRDIWGSIPDALASTANYLKQSKWRWGETWGYEVTLPDGFNYALADEQTRRPIGEWMKHGVRRARGGEFPRANDQAYLMLPAGARGPAFLILPNFKSILAYNNATSYALGVGHLADRLGGGGPFASSWPVGDKPLSATQKRELQTLLSRSGYDTGGVDGKVGPKTRSAIRAYQAGMGLPADGYASDTLLERLR